MKKGHSNTNPLHVIAHEAKEKAENPENKKEEKKFRDGSQDHAILYEKKLHHPDGPGGNYRGL